MREVTSARCPHCDERIKGENVGVMEGDSEASGDQVWYRGALVCPECDRIIGSYSDYHRTDIIEGNTESWDKISGVDEE
ncbi:MAG: hypothetical protein SV760_09960 [Halobacteria archaeon]|nr:hypothetical protein [Halobacteria archaeon]